MLKGHVDFLSCSKAHGWACDDDDFAEKLSISVYYDGNEIAKSIANNKREDLKTVHECHDFAFSIDFDCVVDVQGLKIVAKMANGEFRELFIDKSNVITQSGYQSFENQKGDSNSVEKLKALRLPERYDGLSVLDIGCNEGFFCIDAYNRGAKRVVGIDADEKVINMAKLRTTNVEYIHTDWWHLPDEKFDIIYFMSAIHYENNQKKLLDMLCEHLTENGKLILECGVLFNSVEPWTSVRRHDGYLKFPSFQFLTEVLLKKYCVTPMNKSVQQAGDPVPRFVFNCSPRKPVIVFIAGSSGIGKTYVASLLAKGDSVVQYSLDPFFYTVKTSPFLVDNNTPIYKLIKNNCDLNEIDKFVDQLDDTNKIALAECFCEAIPLEADCVMLEGYPLSIPLIKETLHTRLTKNGAHVWNLSKFC